MEPRATLPKTLLTRGIDNFYLFSPPFFAVYLIMIRYDLNKGRRFKYGRGIYSTPDPAIAEDYAAVFQFKGEKYKVLLQNRVNMEHTDIVTHMNYFVTATEDNIRPYGLLFKKM